MLSLNPNTILYIQLQERSCNKDRQVWEGLFILPNSCLSGLSLMYSFDLHPHFPTILTTEWRVSCYLLVKIWAFQAGSSQGYVPLLRSALQVSQRLMLLTHGLPGDQADGIQAKRKCLVADGGHLPGKPCILVILRIRPNIRAWAVFFKSI